MYDYIPSVIRVLPKDDFHVEVLFDNGKIVDLDVATLWDEPGYEVLKDISVFKNTCTVLGGTLAWDLTGKRDEFDCLDVDPMWLYHCKTLRDDLIFMGMGVTD